MDKNNFVAKQRLEDKRQEKLKIIPDKYILLITTPEKAYVIEGIKDFTEYHDRQATTTAWCEFMLALSQMHGLKILNKKYRLSYFPPKLATPQHLYGMTIQHLQDGTVCFGGRMLSNCSGSSQETTTELLSYFDELVAVNNEETRALLEKYCFAVHEL